MFKFITTISFILYLSQLALSQQWLSGKWEGKGHETAGGSTLTMKLSAQKGRYRVEYPSLKCSGNWKLLSYNKSEARFRENIKVNRKACEPTGNVIIQRLKNNRILFTYSYIESSKTAAKAILRKRN